MASPVERDEIAVMYLPTKFTPEDIQGGFARKESLVALKGRKFFGAFYPDTQEYRVCVQLREDDDARALGLEHGFLPGGRSLRERLRGEPPGIYEQIGPTFIAMASEARIDATRPNIEFYRARDEIDLLLPVFD